MLALIFVTYNTHYGPNLSWISYPILNRR